MDAIELHDAHIYAWACSFFTYRRDIRLIERRGEILNGELAGQELPFTEIKQGANLIEQGYSWNLSVEVNNPHLVTAAQVGCYVDMPPCWGDPDPNVIDVKVREVEEPKYLTGPENKK